MTQRLFFDCDTGIDDSLALLYLLSRTDVDLMGIGSTAGNVPVDVVTANNLSWLQVCGRTDIPVHRGAATALDGTCRTTEDTHGPLGVGYAELPTPMVTASGTDAADAWIEASVAADGELVGLVTGPLTSLATALSRDPHLPQRLRRLVVMGGAFGVHGNTTPTAEWNITVDPEAAAQVFAAFGRDDAPLPIICPLDVTESIALSPDHLVRLAAAAGSRPVECPDPDDEPGRRSVADNVVVRHVVDAVRFYLEFHRDQGEGYIAHMHDPFAAMVARDPSLAVTRTANVGVELTGTLTRGTTVADERGMWGGTPNARIVTATDIDAVLDGLVESIAALAAVVGRPGETPTPMFG